MLFNELIPTGAGRNNRRPARFARLMLVAAVCGSMSACGPTESNTDKASPRSPPADNVLARFGDIEITIAELDARVVGLKASDRPPPGADLNAWYREQIREMVLDRHFLELARKSGDDRSEAFQRSSEAVRGQIEVELCLKDRLAQMTPLGKADVEKEYDEHRDLFKKTERRLTHHIFRRTSDATTQQAAVTELDALRVRVLNGERFQSLAREKSDSESRHRDGELGWLIRGELPPALDEVVFSLEEGVPSQPVATQDGVHLFFVDSVNLARDASFAEAMPFLKERLQARRMDEVVNKIIEGDSRDFSMPEKARFDELLRTDDPKLALLKDGDFVLTLGEFRRQLRSRAERPENAKRDAVGIGEAWALLGALRNREKLRSACETRNWVDEAALAERMQAWTDAQLVAIRRNKLLLEQAKQDEPRLKQYYEQNLEQFGSPIRWDIKRLLLPLDHKSTAAIAVLEERARSGSTDVDALQAELGGVVQTLKGMQVGDLRRISPYLPKVVAPLEVGKVSPPLRTQEHLEIYEVLAKKESQTKAFEEVKDQVAIMFARHHAADLYSSFTSALFEGTPLEVFPKALERVIEAGLPEQDVSAEELDRLLESM